MIHVFDKDSVELELPEIIATTRKLELSTFGTEIHEVLIDSALANNGMLGYRKDEIEVKKANLKSKRRNWTRNFGIQADTRYGNFNNFSNNVSGSDVVTLASATTQTNYGVGLYLKIPVFDIFNRKYQTQEFLNTIQHRS